jgi:hypothetical protein
MGPVGLQPESGRRLTLCREPAYQRGQAITGEVVEGGGAPGHDQHQRLGGSGDLWALPGRRVHVGGGGGGGELQVVDALLGAENEGGLDEVRYSAHVVFG